MPFFSHAFFHMHVGTAMFDPGWLNSCSTVFAEGLSVKLGRLPYHCSGHFFIWCRGSGKLVFGLGQECACSSTMSTSTHILAWMYWRVVFLEFIFAIVYWDKNKSKNWNHVVVVGRNQRICPWDNIFFGIFCTDAFLSTIMISTGRAVLLAFFWKTSVA